METNKQTARQAEQHENRVLFYLSVLLDEHFSTRLKQVGGATIVLFEILAAIVILMNQPAATASKVGWFVVVAGGAVVFAFGFVLPVGTIISRLQDAEKSEADRSARCATHAGVHGCVARLYGFQRDAVSVSMELAPSGSVVCTDKVTVRALDNRITELRHFLEGGSTGGEPSKPFTAKPVMLKCPVEYDFEDIVADNHGVTWAVTFNPELPYDEPITYSYEIGAPQGTFLMTRAEVLAKPYKYEWLSHEVIYPCKRLEMTVVFPKKWGWVSNKGEAWCDDGKLVCESETRRISEMKLLRGDVHSTDGRQCLNLVVDNPILGMKYVVLWVPKEPRGFKKKPVLGGVVVASE